MKGFFVDHEGQVQSLESIPAVNRGLLYGDGCFTTLRISERQLQFWPDHEDRLQRTANFLGLELPLSTDRLRTILLEAVDASLDYRCRVTVFRSGGGKYIPETNKASVIAEYLPLSDRGVIWRQPKPVMVSEVKLYYAPQNQYKLLDKSTQVRAGLTAQANGFSDAIMLNERGKVVELLSSNIFLQLKGQWMTPPLEDGCLDGVVRKQLMLLMNVQERSLELEDVRKADEVFATNSIEWVRPISFEREYGIEKTREVFERLKALFQV